MLLLQPSQLRDELETIEGIERLLSGSVLKIIKPAHEFTSLFFDCYKYACTELDEDLRCWPEMDTWKKIKFAEKFRNVENPLFGDLAVYFYDDKIREQPFNGHVGIYEGNGMVRSKWGGYGVYLHPLSLVPSSYGDYVEFYRKLR